MTTATAATCDRPATCTRPPQHGLPRAMGLGARDLRIASLDDVLRGSAWSWSDPIVLAWYVGTLDVLRIGSTLHVGDTRSGVLLRGELNETDTVRAQTEALVEACGGRSGCLDEDGCAS